MPNLQIHELPAAPRALATGDLVAIDIDQAGVRSTHPFPISAILALAGDAGAPAFQTNTDYTAGELVFENGNLYRRDADGNSGGAFNEAEWTAIGGNRTVVPLTAAGNLTSPIIGEIRYYSADVSAGTFQSVLPAGAPVGTIFALTVRGVSNVANREWRIAPPAGESISWSNPDGSNPQLVTDFVGLNQNMDLQWAEKVTANVWMIKGAKLAAGVTLTTISNVQFPTETIANLRSVIAGVNTTGKVAGPSGSHYVDMGGGNVVVAHPVGVTPSDVWVEFGTGVRVATPV